MKKVIIDKLDLGDILFDDIDSVISALQQFKIKYKEAEILEIKQEWVGYEDCIFELHIYREETEEEYTTRLEIEACKEQLVKENKKKQRVKEDLNKEITKLQKRIKQLEGAL